MGLITLPHRPTNGTPEDISQIMADFDAILSEVNGNIDNANVKAGAGIAYSKLALSNSVVSGDLVSVAIAKLAGYPGDVAKYLAGDGTWQTGVPGAGAAPTGAMMAYSATPAPSGWLLCDGAAVSRTTYSALFALYNGLAPALPYGVGDGTTTFNVPDLRGRIPVGLGTHADVNALGDNDGISTVANRKPKHKHLITAMNGAGSTPRSIYDGNTGTSVFDTGHYTSPNGADDPIDSPPYLTTNFIVKT